MLHSPWSEATRCWTHTGVSYKIFPQAEIYAIMYPPIPAYSGWNFLLLLNGTFFYLFFSLERRMWWMTMSVCGNLLIITRRQQTSATRHTSCVCAVLATSFLVFGTRPDFDLLAKWWRRTKSFRLANSVDSGTQFAPAIPRAVCIRRFTFCVIEEQMLLDVTDPFVCR